MRRARTIFLFDLLVACVTLCQCDRAKAETTAFYYGVSPPEELFRVYDQVVVEPEHVPDPSVFEGTGAALVAYLSIGEIADASRARAAVDASWIVARHAEWSSSIMDLSAPGFRAHLLDQRFEALWRAGYRRFFLDTLDSYLLGSESQDLREKQRLSLVSLIREMATRHPEVKLLLNRGFEVLDDVRPFVSAVVAESLFDGVNVGEKRYLRMPEESSRLLLERLRDVQKRHRLPVIVIDYRPYAERPAARETARRIAELGFTPWVSDYALSTVGVGSVEIVPRRVLIVTSGARGASGGPPDAVRYLAPVIEHLGYVPVHHSLESGVPRVALPGRYQGVVTWLDTSSVPTDYPEWLVEQVRSGVRVAVFGQLGIQLPSEQGSELLVTPFAPAQPTRGALHVAHSDDLIGFEAVVEPVRLEAPPLRIRGQGVTPHLELADATGETTTLIATTPWGGIAFSHFLAPRGIHGERAWVLDPFRFLERALGLPMAPVPDVTTENGRRFAMITLRAAGLSTRARSRGRPLTITLVRERLIRRGLPHSLDLEQESEGSPSPSDRALAHRLLALDNVREGHLALGTTCFERAHGSITRVNPASLGLDGRVEVAQPLAGDAHYIQSGDLESYPFLRILDTLQRTDAPRRLSAIGIDYHAYSAASVGGLDTLELVYGWLEEREIFPVYAGDYAARARSFRQQVLIRDLDGAFALSGGPLTTVRVPLELGLPDLEKSSGVVSVRTLPQGRYVSFASGGGPRRLVLGAERLTRPHVVQANVEIRALELESTAPERLALSLQVRGDVPAEIVLGGLPPSMRCRVSGLRRAFPLATDEQGVAILRERRLGELGARVSVVCRATRGDDS